MREQQRLGRAIVDSVIKEADKREKAETLEKITERRRLLRDHLAEVRKGADVQRDERKKALRSWRMPDLQGVDEKLAVEALIPPVPPAPSAPRRAKNKTRKVRWGHYNESCPSGCGCEHGESQAAEDRAELW